LFGLSGRNVGRRELAQRGRAIPLVDRWQGTKPFLVQGDRPLRLTRRQPTIGRTGDGCRYDYFHVGGALAERIQACAYLHETRDSRLTDHAAVTLSLAVDDVARLDTRDPTEADPLTLF
jgi:hypothetical protein